MSPKRFTADLVRSQIGFRWRWRRAGAHVKVRLFGGWKGTDNGALCGTLTLTEEEWKVLSAAFEGNAAHELIEDEEEPQINPFVENVFPVAGVMGLDCPRCKHRKDDRPRVLCKSCQYEVQHNIPRPGSLFGSIPVTRPTGQIFYQDFQEQQEKDDAESIRGAGSVDGDQGDGQGDSGRG